MNAAAARPDGWRPMFKADWTRFVFIHYALPPGDLAPFTPLELDCRDGRAFVSLVFFRFDGMRPARFLLGTLGRVLFRPASDNWFLNVRTYVRGAAGPGIQFLIEWIDNPLSLFIGPWLYGLPYRRGRFDCPTGGTDDRSSLRVTDAQTKKSFQVTVAGDGKKASTVDPGSLDGFLLEKYTAYTHHRGVSRFFHISHPHWSVTQPSVLAIDDSLIRASCPWFGNAEMRSAHASAGFQSVGMGAPSRLNGAPRAGRTIPVAQLVPRFQ
jgi:uncharacterized protein